jgi:hypothetical protein
MGPERLLEATVDELSRSPGQIVDRIRDRGWLR